MSSQQKLVLALNAGSSSLKASVMSGHVNLVSFLAERLTTDDAVVHIVPKDENNDKLKRDSIKKSKMSHAEALETIIDTLKTSSMLENLVAVGHRVVHGGSIFSDSVVITNESLAQMESVSHLAPLHNPHNLGGIKVMQKLTNIPNVAVFDTSFHATIPEHAYTYPLPKEYRDSGMRKYGFHGTSVNYVQEKATQLLQTLDNNNKKKTSFQMIVCHLGNGASVTAVSNGQSKETSMGFTPLSGLMMGTRCGSVDPSLVGFACQTLNKSVDDVLTDFNKQSGLKGMSADGNFDMRVLLSQAKKADIDEKIQQAAKLAVDMFVYRLAQHIASSLVALDGDSGLDALIFTAGIGEHSAEIRSRTMQQLRNVLPKNVVLDENRNNANGETSNGILTPDGVWPVVLDIATDEEVMIAKECLRLI